MAFGKDIFCRGIDVYNLCDTDETSVSVTTYVGHSMSTGPKVAIRRNRPFRLAYTEEDEQVIVKGITFGKVVADRTVHDTL